MHQPDTHPLRKLKMKLNLGILRRKAALLDHEARPFIHGG